MRCRRQKVQQGENPREVAQSAKARNSASRVIRSYLFIAAMVILAAPYVLFFVLIFLPRPLIRKVYYSYLRASMWLLKVICKTTFQVQGMETVPSGPVIFASKHQSHWDSAFLPMLLGDPVAIVKREILYLPVLGWIGLRMGHIFIDRTGGPSTFARLVAKVRGRAAEGRSILIFPEGTRKSAKPYDQPDYHTGAAALYQVLGLPCVPIALNSGLYWPAKSMLRYEGVVRVKVLPAIPAGLSRREFHEVLASTIEAHSRHLAEVGEREGGSFVTAEDRAGARTY